MLNLKFSLETNDPALLLALKEYQSIWDKDGSKIKEAMEKVSSLAFTQKEISVIVFEGMSTSGSDDFPMKLRGSYSLLVKKGTLVHELGHRLIAQIKNRPAELDEHRILFLILYDIWTDIYGQKFADEMVAVEKGRKGYYDYASAWDQTLNLTRKEREAKFNSIKI